MSRTQDTALVNVATTSIASQLLGQLSGCVFELCFKPNLRGGKNEAHVGSLGNVSLGVSNSLWLG